MSVGPKVVPKPLTPNAVDMDPLALKGPDCPDDGPRLYLGAVGNNY